MVGLSSLSAGLASLVTFLLLDLFLLLLFESDDALLCSEGSSVSPSSALLGWACMRRPRRDVNQLEDLIDLLGHCFGSL